MRTPSSHLRFPEGPNPLGRPSLPFWLCSVWSGPWETWNVPHPLPPPSLWSYQREPVIATTSTGDWGGSLVRGITTSIPYTDNLGKWSVLGFGRSHVGESMFSFPYPRRKSGYRRKVSPDKIVFRIRVVRSPPVWNYSCPLIPLYLFKKTWEFSGSHLRDVGSVLPPAKLWHRRGSTSSRLSSRYGSMGWGGCTPRRSVCIVYYSEPRFWDS